jgi:hypothetical protein
MTTTVVEDLGAMTHWHTIQIMNWSPEEAQSKFAKEDVTGSHKKNMLMKGEGMELQQHLQVRA